MTGLSRRQFLGLAGGAAGVALGGTVVWSRLVDDQVTDHTAASPEARSTDRILVVIELAGGNDGLNTLVPADGRYHDARPTLAIADTDLVALSGETGYGMHPALAPLAPVWAAGRLAAVQGIGLADQTRSHFAATDAWRAGGGTGSASWLGRWLDATAGERATPLRAIALGTDTRILAAEHSLSTVIKEPDSFQLLVPSGPATDPDAVVAAFTATSAPVGSDPLFAAAQHAIPATLEALDVFGQATAVPGGRQTNPDPGADTRKATRFLETAARIIELDVGAQVLVVGVDGFDTHATQPDRHRQLLADVGTGLAGFLDAIEQQGRSDDVLVVTTSEFGRRVVENGSMGSDHGKANTLLLTGAAVNGAIVGDSGLAAIDDEGDLPLVVDARSLYAVALDWLGGPTDEILGGTYDRFGLT